MEFFNQLVAETEPARTRMLSAPIIDRCINGEIALDDYVAFLVQAYHHVKHTVPLLMSVGARLPGTREWLREAIREYINEEMGHQEWVLNDIASCGYDKEFVRNSMPVAAPEIMVAYAYDLVQRVNPLGFFGMVHVLEGTSVNLATTVADIIKTKLDLPKNALTYLYSHGSLDQEHVAFFAQLMDRIRDEEEQQLIIHSSRIFYQLYGNIFRALSPEHGVPQRLKTT